MKKNYLLGFLFLGIGACNSFAQEIPSDEVKRILYTLAADSMHGRPAGNPLIEKSARFIENEFAQIGLGYFDTLKSYRQTFRKNNRTYSNIIGVLEGKSRKNEFIIFSAHYDHIGILQKIEGDSIANGADDDASGVTAVISLARYFKKQMDNERTLIFVAFTAEEIGGFGSKYFAEQIKAENVIAGINIEMIGKIARAGKKTAFITGFEKSDLGNLLQKNSQDFIFTPDPYPFQNLFYRSDNASLARKGIPAHTISSVQIDKDKYYHTVEDEVETLDVENMTTIIGAIAHAAKPLISGKQTPNRIKE